MPLIRIKQTKSSSAMIARHGLRPRWRSASS